MNLQVQVDRNLSNAGYKSVFLFNNVRFLKLNNTITPISFRLNKSNNIIAALHFSLIDNKAISLSQTPFGGLDFGSEASEHDLVYFLEQVLTELKARNITAVELQLPPSSYAPEMEAFQDAILKKLGFEIIVAETNCHIEVNPTTTFWSILHSSEKNKLNKCLKKGFEVRELDIENFDAVYDLILDNRKAKGFPMTMERIRLKKMISHFKEYHLFGCFDGIELVACTVSIEVNESVLYNFYMADSMFYRPYSPLVYLNEFIYKWCIKHSFSQLDLGTASVGGVINEGLFSFKKNLGAKVSGKIRFGLFDF